MKFSIVVYGAPYSSEAASTALNFAKAVLANGHTLYRIFFFQDGVHNATTLSVPPQDEQHIPEDWKMLIAKHGIDAVICVASGLKRGILDQGESRRYNRQAVNLSSEFSISGLGQLVDASLKSDRLINFGV